MTVAYRRKPAQGITIVRLMVALAIVGVIVRLAADLLIHERCRIHPSLEICAPAGHKINVH